MPRTFLCAHSRILNGYPAYNISVLLILSRCFMLDDLTLLALNYIYLLLGVSNGQFFPPPLKKEEERELFISYKEGNEESRTKLIEHNLRLVSHIVRKYYSTSKNQEDLISIGSIGLIKAIDSFNIKNGARFATYAAKCIQNEILMYFRSQKKLSQEVSINDTIDVDRDGNPLTYIDIICVEDTIAEDIDKKMHTAKALNYIKNILSAREREIIVMRYGLCDKPCKTQREVAEILGISRSYVSRIEKSALDKLSAMLHQM